MPEHCLVAGFLRALDGVEFALHESLDGGVVLAGNEFAALIAEEEEVEEAEARGRFKKIL